MEDRNEGRIIGGKKRRCGKMEKEREIGAQRVRERKREQKDERWEDRNEERMQEGKKRINRKM